MSKYGFDGGIDLPPTPGPAKPRAKLEAEAMEKAVQAGTALGFVSREPTTRLRPGPKRTEAQDKVSIPGPKRVIDEFRNFCRTRDMTLWQGLDHLLKAEKGRDA